ncbi:hypothetical protein BH11CYA1_BH11CYA1_35800 [soil metagenome]
MAGHNSFDRKTESAGLQSGAEDARDNLILAAFKPERKSESSAQSEKQTAESIALNAAESRNNLPTRDKISLIGALAGPSAATRVGAGLEAGALIHALNHDPTPEGLGKEGCMAAISRYVLEPQLKESGKVMPHFIDSHAFLNYVSKHPELATISSKSQREIQSTDLQPGDIIIGEKSTGNHVMVVTRVPANWGYPEGSLMLCGNTGLAMPDGPPYPHFRAAQEVLGAGTDRYNYHHGQLNSQLSTNPYLGGRFKIVRFKD